MAKFIFEPIQRRDFHMLSSWLATDHVRRWWADNPDVYALEDTYGAVIDGIEPCEVYIAHTQGLPIGLIQRYRFYAYPQFIDELAPILPTPSTALSIDYLLGPTEFLGKGLGAAMIAEFIALIWHIQPVAPCIIVPVHAENVASWRALERAGFNRAATGELKPDNPNDNGKHYIYRIENPFMPLQQA